MQYHRARYYDPAAGRWISEDPIKFAARDLNLSLALGNNPASGVDPSGLQTAGAGTAKTAPLPVHVGAYASGGNMPVLPPWPKGDGRNKNNVAPLTEQEAIALGFEKCPPSAAVFHQPGKKYIGPDGHWEAVYDDDGKLITDPGRMGSYNYYDYRRNPVLHFWFDMVPYWLYGNDDDPGSATPPTPVNPPPTSHASPAPQSGSIRRPGATLDASFEFHMSY